MEISSSSSSSSADGQFGQQQQQANDQQQQQATSNQQQSQQQHNQQPPYTIPGILHYLQYEWHRFEVERQEWEVEKAELAARIALLQGEKKSHENLKHDLIRRIKMLEYCLRMERAKYHKLKHGIEETPVESNKGSPQQDAENTATQLQQQPTRTTEIDDGFINSNNSCTITYGRELLKHYLQEIGYTDTIIDLRSNRVRSLLGIVDNNQEASNQQQTQNSHSTNPNISDNSNVLSSIKPDFTDNNVIADQSKTKSLSNVTTSRNTNLELNRRGPTSLLSNNATANKQLSGVGDAESSVLATFEFLYDQEGAKDSNQLDEEEEEISEDAVDAADRAASTSTSEYSFFKKESSEATSIIEQKLDMLNNGKTTASASQAGGPLPPTSDPKPKLEATRQAPDNDLAQSNMSFMKQNRKGWNRAPVDIGELASLTSLNSETNVDDYRKKQWTNKYRLQSHFDCVRALRFIETESLLVTASEDETIKLWHLSRQSSTGGKSRQQNLPPAINAISSLDGSIIDIEPLRTYRGHTSRILAITVCKNNIFSGAQNGELIMWKMISDPGTADQYDKFDHSLLVCKFDGHDDAVWSVETFDHPKSEPLLCSASADLTIKVWLTDGSRKEHILVINLESSPTCIAIMPPYNVCRDEADIAVSSCDGKIRLYDIAACLRTNDESNTQPTAVLECDDSFRINSIVIHPTLPYLASADSNRSIKFWDLETKKCKSTMVAHLDEVTSLACDPKGKYLLSASHDCSARLWLFEEKACIQEITSHRKKFDEGIFAVAFHPSSSHFATAGADGLAKVFV